MYSPNLRTWNAIIAAGFLNFALYAVSTVLADLDMRDGAGLLPAGKTHCCRDVVDAAANSNKVGALTPPASASFTKGSPFTDPQGKVLEQDTEAADTAARGAA